MSRNPLRVYTSTTRLIKTVPRTSHKEVTRHKAYGFCGLANATGSNLSHIYDSWSTR